MSCDVKLYIGNSNVVQLGTTASPLTNTTTGLVDTGATVTCTMYDMTDVEVTGETWPVSMIDGTGGIYRAALASGIAITEGDMYKIVISATGSGGEVGTWTVERKAEVRSCD